MLVHLAKQIVGALEIIYKQVTNQFWGNIRQKKDVRFCIIRTSSVLSELLQVCVCVCVHVCEGGVMEPS